MNKVTVAAPAKLNLSLDVVKKRDDGYHEMDMINCAVSLADSVTVSLCKDGVFGFGDVLHEKKDLCIKAAEVFFAETGLNCGAKITLKKNIPVLGGLGGGSADAAAVIKALNELCGTKQLFDELNRIAVKVGADVPFCLWGNVARVKGIGEIIIPVDTRIDCTFLLVKAQNKLSTAEMFLKADSIKNPYHPDTEKAVYCLQNGDIKSFCKYAGNTFDGLWQNGDIKKLLLENGADIALTTGSGPTLYAMFKDAERAEYCKKIFERNGVSAWVCKPFFN